LHRLRHHYCRQIRPPQKKEEERDPGSNVRRAGLCRRDFLQAPTRGKI
jgi:hypothetical protein